MEKEQVIATMAATHGTVRIVVRDWKNAHPYRVEWLEKGKRSWKCIDGCADLLSAKKIGFEAFCDEDFAESI